MVTSYMELIERRSRVQRNFTYSTIKYALSIRIVELFPSKMQEGSNMPGDHRWYGATFPDRSDPTRPTQTRWLTYYTTNSARD